MLAKILQGAGGAGVVYSDITVVTSGSALGNATATFGTSLLQNDVVFLTIGFTDTDWSVPAGYVQYTGGVLSGIYQYACYYKVMGATPDTSINIGDANDSSAFTYYALRGVQTEAPVIETSNIIGTTTAALNPPSVSVFAKCMVLAAAFTGNGSTASLTAGPSGYSGFLGVDAAGNNDTYIGTAYKTITATGTEDPGAFTLSNTAAAYGSVSIVIRPYSASFSWQGPEFVASATGSTASGTTLTINKPSSPNATLEGDLMIAFMGAGAGATWTGDTGWTEIADQGSNPSIRVAYKVAGASEGSSYTFTSSASSVLAGGIITYRYAAYDAIGSITTATNPLILPEVTPSLSQSLLLAFGARGANTTVGTPAGMTSRISRTTSPSYNVADQPIPKGASGTRSVTVGSATNVSGVMLAIKPTRSV